MRTSVDVHNFLQGKGIQHEIFLVDTAAKTATRAAALLQLDPSEVLKSVMFFADQKPVLVILPANRQVSYKKLKQVLGTQAIKLADAQSVIDTTGYVLGATPPFALQTGTRTLIDKSVMGRDVVYTGGGELNAMLKLRSEDLKQATSAEVADVAD